MIQSREPNHGEESFHPADINIALQDTIVARYIPTNRHHHPTLHLVFLFRARSQLLALSKHINPQLHLIS